MIDLAIVIPSKGRPEQAARLVERIAETAVTAVRTCIVVPLGDPRSLDYAEVVPQGTPVVFDGSGCHVGAINAGAAYLSQAEPYAYAKLDDDHWPVTPGWNLRLVSALRQLGTGIAYGNDLLQGANLPTAPCITADIYAALGYLAPPCLRHLYCDNFWRDLALGAGCLAYLEDVIIEHRHFTNGKSSVDDTYRHANSDQNVIDDKAAYQKYLSQQLGRDIDKVVALRKD